MTVRNRFKSMRLVVNGRAIAYYNSAAYAHRQAIAHADKGRLAVVEFRSDLAPRFWCQWCAFRPKQ